MKTIILTANEYEIVSLMWRESRPLTRAEILKLSPPDKSWKDKSIHILLNSLLDKGAIVVDGYARSGKNYGRTYMAAISKDEYLAMQLTMTMPSSDDSTVNLSGIFSALVNNRKIDGDTIRELEDILESKKKEIFEGSSDRKGASSEGDTEGQI